jgi:hypothetical protein
MLRFIVTLTSSVRKEEVEVRQILPRTVTANPQSPGATKAGAGSPSANQSQNLHKLISVSTNPIKIQWKNAGCM